MKVRVAYESGQVNDLLLRCGFAVDGECLLDGFDLRASMAVVEQIMAKL